MDAADPRHGSDKGNRQHYREGEKPCDACRAANQIAQRRGRKTRVLYGNRCVPTLGTKRRVEALMCLGWSTASVAGIAGLSSYTDLWNIVNRPSGTIRKATADRIAQVYDELSMRPPMPTTRGERISVARALGMAQRKGYAPPLAWDDIDDPDEQPTRWHYVKPKRADAMRDLLDLGFGVTEVCRRLKVGRDALEKWAARNGMADEFRVLVARETPEREVA